jgi:LPS sulfotransferase NodH
LETLAITTGDFPYCEEGMSKPPHTCYLICAVQRSGSTLLCEALKNTGLAGRPDEYFLCTEGYSWEDSPLAREHGVSTNVDTISLILRQGTTPNGVFGAKVMWNYLGRMIQHLEEIPAYRGLEAPQLLWALFPNLHYIWLTRRDKVQQAVSWAKAAKTGIWARTGEESPGIEPEFDFELVDNLVRLIDEGERGWAQFFTACGVTPYKVRYADVVQSYERTALDILDYLGVPYPKALAFGERRMRRQANELDAKWVQMYREAKAAHGKHDAR